MLGLTLSASARDLHEVLHEEVIECAFINHLHPWGEREGGRTTRGKSLGGSCVPCLRSLLGGDGPWPTSQ